MKNLLASGMYVFLTLSATLNAQNSATTMENVKNHAEEQIKILDIYFEKLNTNFPINHLMESPTDLSYFYGYIQGSKNAYLNILDKIQED